MTAPAILRMPRPVPRCLPGAALHLRALNRLGCAIVAVSATAATVTGCATATVAGHEVPGEAARRATDLNAVLLTDTELDAALGAAGMATDTTTSTMVDDTPYTTPTECLAVSSHGRRAGVRRDELDLGAHQQRPTYTVEGQPATVWDVGPAAEKSRILAVTLTEHDSDSWACQRALTAAVNIVVEPAAAARLNPVDAVDSAFGNATTTVRGR